MGKIINWVRYSLNRKVAIYITAITILLVIAVLNITNIKAYISNQSEYLQTFKQYIKYQYRTSIYSGGELITAPLSHSWVNIEGFTSDGRIALRKYTSNGIETVFAELADLKIKDVTLSALIVKEYIRQQAEVDYYEYEQDGKTHKCVVIWLDDGRPLNLVLIEQKVATPVIKPPTNIVNELMLTYYKGLL